MRRRARDYSWLNSSDPAHSTEEIAATLLLAVGGVACVFFNLVSSTPDSYSLFIGAMCLLVAVWTFFDYELGISREAEGWWPYLALFGFAVPTGLITWLITDVQIMFYWLSFVVGAVILASAFKLIVLRWLLGRP